MQYHFFLLQALCPIIEKSIRGFTLVSCFSQNKDELVLEFNNGNQSFFIRTLLDPAFSCITFPTAFHRARKNSIDLFTEVLMRTVTGVQVIAHERSFTLTLTDGYGLLFKMHGNRSNILLLHNGVVVDLFKKQLVADKLLTPAVLARSIDWSEQAFHANLGQLPAHYPVLGKMVWSYLEEQGFGQADETGKWKLFQACLARLQKPSFFIVAWRGAPAFSLLPIGQVLREYQDPITALNDFCAHYLATTAFQRAKHHALTELENQRAKYKAQLDLAQERLAQLSTDSHYQQWADIIMANLHRAEPGSATLTAENFYDNNSPICIPLKKELSAQKNAEVFYRKSKNQSIEVRQLKTTIEEKTTALHVLNERLTQVQQATHLHQLADAQPAPAGAAQTKSLPYHTHHVNGFELRVGKNAAANDLMLRAHAHKNDLWFHAKDAPGSHVILRHRAGQDFPKPVMERAAALAAYYSKRKTEGLVPVAYTLCKYVRKRKGDPPGAVVVEREETMLVPPAP